jgi:Protein kinase domain
MHWWKFLTLGYFKIIVYTYLLFKPKGKYRQDDNSKQWQSRICRKLESRSNFGRRCLWRVSLIYLIIKKFLTSNNFFSLVSLSDRVKLLINRQTGEAVAMKKVDLEKHPDAVFSVKKEVCIQKVLNHANVLKFYGKRTQGTIEYIFLEYAAGGELFDRIGK